MALPWASFMQTGLNLVPFGTDHGFSASLSAIATMEESSMPRRPRITLPGVPLHLIQRHNNRQACFYADEDYQSYLSGLKEYSQKSKCAVHAYVLMTDHVYLLVTARTAAGAGQVMKRLGQRYVQCVNRSYHCSGTLWC